MTILDDEFDLDLRLSVASPEPSRPGAGRADPRAETDDDTVAPQQTCPADTCELGCETQTCPEETCGCNTSETCDQRIEDCGGGITFGPYCEDASGGEDSCDACPPPGSDMCPDPPDVD
jgi:hypothetical protein